MGHYRLAPQEGQDNRGGSEMTQPDLFDITRGAKTGGQLRDEGIKKAIDHTEEVTTGWTERAMDFVEEYARTHPGPFKCEDIRTASIWTKVPRPSSEMAWGGIMTRAKGRGWIEKVGLGPVKNAAAHCANAGTWVSLIYRGGRGE